MSEDRAAPWLVNQKTLAAFFQRSVTAIQRWNLEPHSRDGRDVLYDLRAIVAERYGKQDNVLDLNRERARLAAAQARKTELEIAEREGELVAAEAVSQAWARALVAFRQECLTLCNAVARDERQGLALEVAGPAIRDAIRGALERLAAFDPVPDAPARGDPPGARAGAPAAAPVGDAVGGRKPRTVKRKRRGAGKMADQ